jgi:putative phage-type endonuclease
MTFLDCIEHYVEQRSPAWHQLRLGRLTGSRAKDALAVGRGGEAYTKRDYRLELCCERLTGVPVQTGHVSADMMRGLDVEPYAIEALEYSTGLIIKSSGFISSTDHMIGCSLDGYTGSSATAADLIIEVKCPKSTTHLKWLKSGQLPPEHLAQIRHNLWCSNAQAAWFISYDNRLPYDLSLYRVELARKDADLNSYEDQAMSFLESVDAMMEELENLKHGGTA